MCSHLEEAFAEFDADKSGFITKEELSNAMQAAISAGFECSKEDMEACIQFILTHADVNKDGKISKAEFVKFSQQFLEQK